MRRSARSVKGRRKSKKCDGGRGEDAAGTPTWPAVGDRLEVRSDEEGFIGVWYAAEVVHIEHPSSCIVEYEELLSDDGLPLQEIVPLRNLRPCPPSLPPRTSWCQDHLVEAYDRDGWWAGIVGRSLPGNGHVLVRFPTTGEELTFPPSLLRGLQNWDNGKWTDLTQIRRTDNVLDEDGDDNDRHADVVDHNNFRNLHHEAPERQTSDQKNKLLGVDHSSSFSKESSQMTCSDQCDAPCHASGHLTGASSRLTGCKLSASMEEFEAQVSANDHSTLLREALKGEVRLELVTYELLVKAIHLKGPLNWAQEKLLTDVRLQLGITSAEQAIVLKKYMPSSDGTG